MMRNENMIEPQNPQCVQARVSGCFFYCNILFENVYIFKNNDYL